MKNRYSNMRILFLLVCLSFLITGVLFPLPDIEDAKKVCSAEDLFRIGPQRVFEGRFLSQVAFPLGGIGTGMISLGGRGNIMDWEIFNRPGKGVNLPLTHFCLYVKEEGKEPIVRVLEGPLHPPLREDYGHGYPRGLLPGLPRMEKARFSSQYPFAQVELEDSRIPLEVTLEAFNPFIPLEPEHSGIPGCVIRYRVKNNSNQKVKITIVGSVMNPIGFDGSISLNARSVNRTLYRDYFGRNVNEFRAGDTVSGLFMSSEKLEPDSPQFGTMALATPWKEITYLSHWIRGSWFDDFHVFLDDLMDDGRFDDLAEIDPSPDGRTDMGSLGLTADLEPNEEVTLPFVLTWHFPNFLNYFDRLTEMRGRIYKNNYILHHTDAWETAEYLITNLPWLEEESRQFANIFFDQSLPPYVLEAVSSQASIIRTPTCFWLHDGSFFAFEGCNVTTGCCPLNCTHVWNYAQSMAFLFPRLERSMRQTDFLNNVKPDGEMAFRTTLPLGSGKYWRQEPHPAADGQMGTIIRLFRDWQISGDNHFLTLMWPNAKKALEYAWKTWDQNRDGILTGKQHNTFDIEFYGISSMTGTLYLGALVAGAKMAEAMGDHQAAREYRKVFERGRTKLVELTWNGDYFVQKYDQAAEDKYQYGKGCVSDQLFGQWLSQISGLGLILSPDHTRTALSSIFKYNFKTGFQDLYHNMRTFALGDERGLINCSWPRGERPPVPFVYAFEVWTGTEYQVASHLIYEGFLEEGLTIVKAIRDRHDGWKRNPWNEEESGNHYARAMSSWGVLLALTGFEYSGIDQSMGFDPKLSQDDFRCFWSCGSGWGRFAQKWNSRNTNQLELNVAHGELTLKSFAFHLPPGLGSKHVSQCQAFSEKKPIKLKFRQEGGRIQVSFDNPLKLNARENLTFHTQF